MGILLLQNKQRKKTVVPNPVVRSLNILYAAPPEGSDESSGSGANDLKPQLKDPSSLPIAFIPQDTLANEIKMTSP